jgi:hypothetical protein
MTTSNLPTPDAPSDPGAGGDPLADLDAIMAALAARDRASDDRSTSRLDAVERFQSAFAEACQTEVRPAMEAVIERLRANGGGGLIHQHPGGEPRFRHPSCVAWLSLEGEILGDPRPDRHGYLQIEADVTAREILISEGDMREGGGGSRSGRAGTWQLSDLTQERVRAELVEIVRRSAQ